MATKLGGRVPDLSGMAGPSNRAAVKTGGPAGNRWMEERMNITTIGRGNVGGALARRWGRAAWRQCGTAGRRTETR
jgi:hypothetical protein